MPEPDVISAIASTVMSMVVAVVALMFTYRQNVGWEPVALVTHRSMGGTGGSWRFTLNLNVEFWNRRKYPVAMRFAKAELSGIEILDSDPADPNRRNFVRRNCAYREPDQMVEPNTSTNIVFEVSFENQSLDALQPLFQITVGYFDPQKNRHESLQLEERFFYPELGWKKSPEQRSKIIEVFEKLKADDKDRRASEREKRQLKAAAKRLLPEHPNDQDAE